MLTLPTYDMGPGRSQEELVVNVLIYGMVIAMLLSMVWVLLPFAQHVRERRRR